MPGLPLNPVRLFYEFSEREEQIGGFGHGGQRCAAAGRAGKRRGQQTGDLAQLGAGVADGCGNGVEALAGVGGQERDAGLRTRVGFLPGVLLGREAMVDLSNDLACAGKGVPFGVDKALDLQNEFDVAAAVKAVAGSAFVGFELGELRLPKAQDVGFEGADAGDISNFEVKAVGDFGRFEGAFLGEMRSHEGDEEGHRKRRGSLTLDAVYAWICTICDARSKDWPDGNRKCNVERAGMVQASRVILNESLLRAAFPWE